MRPLPKQARKEKQGGQAVQQVSCSLVPPSLSPVPGSGALDSTSSRGCSSGATLPNSRRSFRQRHLLPPLLLLTLAGDTVMPRNRFSLHLSNILPPPPPCFLPSPNSRRFFNASEIFSGQHRNLSQHHFSFFSDVCPVQH